MAIIRLPVCGDYVDQSLVCGVSARGFRGQTSVVTVWVAPNSEVADEIFVFQQFEVATLARAQMVRNQIAELCGLDGEEEDPDTVIEDPEEDDGEGGEGDEDDPEEVPSEEDGDDLSALEFDGSEMSAAEATEILELWNPASKAMN